MSTKEPTISPMTFYGPGCCPDCMIPMVVADKETNVIALDQNGSASDIILTCDECVAICPKCKKKFNMMRSNGVYKPYSDVVYLLDKMEIDYEAKKRREQGKYHVDINPLVELAK